MTLKNRKAEQPAANPADPPAANPPTDGALTVSRQELLIDGSDTAFRDLLHDFFAFAAQMEKARAMFGEHIGLSSTQYMALITISRIGAGGELGINQLAEHLHLSGAFVTIEVNKLVKAGYVVKHPHPVDGRRIIAEMTPRGAAALERLAAFQRPVNDALFASLDARRFAQLRTIFSGLADNGEKALRLAAYMKDLDG